MTLNSVAEDLVEKHGRRTARQNCRSDEWVYDGCLQQFGKFVSRSRRRCLNYLVCKQISRVLCFEAIRREQVHPVLSLTLSHHRDPGEAAAMLHASSLAVNQIAVFCGQSDRHSRTEHARIFLI